MIKVANHRRHHAILPKQQTHCIEWSPDFPLKGHEVTRFIVAIGDINLDVFVINFVAFDPKFARVGMNDGHPVTLCQMLLQNRLFIRTIVVVLWLNQTQTNVVSANGTRMIDQHLQEEFTLVTRQLDVQFGVLRQQSWHDITHHQLFS